jgi:predicted amidohydrolase YtcJ
VSERQPDALAAVGELGDDRWASYVLTSGRLFLMSDDHDVVDGYICVRDGMVYASGSGEVPSGLRDLAHIDVGSTPVLPAFVDPHMHLEQAAVATYGLVDCHAEVTGSIDAIIEQLRAHRELGDARDGWLLGQANLFMDRRLAERRYPTRDDLDKVSDKSPVVLRCASHVSILNSVALERLLACNPKLRPDSAIDTDETGRANGVTHDLFHELGVPELTEEQVEQAVGEAADRWLTRNGVATCGEITDTSTSLEKLAGLVASGRVPQRVNAYPCVPWLTSTVAEAIEVAERHELLSERFGMDCIKVFIDGGYSAHGAAVLRPYRARPGEQTEHFGRMAYTDAELVEIIGQVDDAGRQLVVHTNGERAQRAVCDAALWRDRSGGLPIRLEHAGNFISDFATIDRWRAAGAVPVAQAAFIWTMGPFMPDYLGDYAYDCLMPFRSLLEKGIDLSFASDAAASDPTAFSPMFNMRCATTRVGCTDELINPDEAIDFMTALRMHTVAPARAMRLEGKVGALVPGAHADFLLLSADPSSVEPSKLANISIDHTFIGGRRVGGTQPFSS